MANNPLGAVDPSGHEAKAPWQERYERTRNSFAWANLFGLRDGRDHVRQNLATIQGLAVDYQLLVAASIAHQAGCLRDRPFGISVGDQVGVWLNGEDNTSLGIAQLTPFEMRGLLGPGHNPKNEKDAIYGMCVKIQRADEQILGHDPSINITDRYMLLAICQNSSAGDPIGTFFATGDAGANRDWGRMLSRFKDSGSWGEQLRRVLLELEWALEQDLWQAPEGLDLDRWRQTAFEDPQEQ